jgi:hypothetical protein
VAKSRTIDDHLTMVANHLATAITGYFAPGGARQVKIAEPDLHFLNPKEHTVRHSFVSFQLLLIFSCYF